MAAIEAALTLSRDSGIKTSRHSGLRQWLYFYTMFHCLCRYLIEAKCTRCRFVPTFNYEVFAVATTSLHMGMGFVHVLLINPLRAAENTPKWTRKQYTIQQQPHKEEDDKKLNAEV